MKINQKLQDIKTIGEFDEIVADIKPEDIGLVLMMASENLYSDPIGSIIREITSNAVDANVDLEGKNPVIVRLYELGDTYYISFKDEGTGMSVDTFNNIYCNWFSSDKRDTNAKLGGWGLGSKSPLSYVDSFEIETIHDGVKRTYVYAKGNPRPTATPLTTEEVDEPNGTTIIMEVKPSDISVFSAKFRTQLAYFDNVYVANEIQYYDNKFKLYDYGTFVLRNDYQPFRTMHIWRDQVAYPINWEVIDMAPINIPLAIKFTADDIGVTLSREEIAYDEETVRVITERISVVINELLEIYQEQTQIDDLKEYIDIVNDNRAIVPLRLEDVEFEVSNIPAFKTKVTFAPFNINIKQKHIKFIFAAYESSILINGKNEETSINVSTIVTNHYYSSYLVAKRTNKYDNLFIDNGYLIRRKKITKEVIFQIAAVIGILDQSEVTTVHKFAKGVESPYLKAMNFIKFVDKYVKNNVRPYEGQATEEWIANYKQEQQELYQERKQKVTYYDLRNSRNSTTIGELKDNHKVVFYIDKTDFPERIVHYYRLHALLPKYFKETTPFLIVSPSTIPKFKHKRNKGRFVHIKYIFNIAQFQGIFYRLYLTEEIKKCLPVDLMTYYSDYYTSKLVELNKLCITYRHYEYCRLGENDSVSVDIDFLKYFSKELNTIRDKKKGTTYMEDTLQELLIVSNKLDILRYLKTDMPHKYVYNILKPLKILKLKPIYYTANPY